MEETQYSLIRNAKDIESLYINIIYHMKLAGCRKTVKGWNIAVKNVKEIVSFDQF